MRKLKAIKTVKCTLKLFLKTAVTIGRSYDVYEMRGGVYKIRNDEGKLAWLDNRQFK